LAFDHVKTKDRAFLLNSTPMAARFAAVFVVLGSCAGGACAAEETESFFFSKEAPVGSADTVANVPAMSSDDDDSPAPDKNREGGETFRFLEQVGLPEPKMLPVALDPATAFTYSRSSDGGSERSFTFTMEQEYVWLDPAHPAPGRRGAGTTPFVRVPHRTNTFTVTRLYDASALPAVHVTRIVPAVSRGAPTPDGTLVHHMNIYLCTPRAAAAYPAVTRALPRSLDPASGDGSCEEMIYAWDRDAGALALPENVGFRLGAGTPYSHLAWEVHYLMPSMSVAALPAYYEDRSKLALVLTADLREHSGGMLGFMDESMKLPPGDPAYVYSVETAAGTLARSSVAHDIAAAGKGVAGVSVFAVHLHAHSHGKKIMLEHYAGGVKVGEFGRFDHYGGYGADETWQLLLDDAGAPLPPRGAAGTTERFLPGNGGAPLLGAADRLRMTCVMDTLHATPFAPFVPTYPIYYGLRVGTEMCGALMMYYPHDWRRTFQGTGEFFFEADQQAPADANPHSSSKEEGGNKGGGKGSGEGGKGQGGTKAPAAPFLDILTPWKKRSFEAGGTFDRLEAANPNGMTGHAIWQAFQRAQKAAAAAAAAAAAVTAAGGGQQAGADTRWQALAWESDEKTWPGKHPVHGSGKELDASWLAYLAAAKAKGVLGIDSFRANCERSVRKHCSAGALRRSCAACVRKNRGHLIADNCWIAYYESDWLHDLCRRAHA
jgi:hypothetical protein